MSTAAKSAAAQPKEKHGIYLYCALLTYLRQTAPRVNFFRQKSARTELCHVNLRMSSQSNARRRRQRLSCNRSTGSIQLCRCAMQRRHLWGTWRSTVVPVLLFLVLGRTSIIPIVFTNEEISIDFAGQFSLRDKPGKTLYGDYLPQPLTSVDFCPWRPQPPEVQQVMRPERGYLCELHILPFASETQALRAIRNAHAHESHRYARNGDLRTVEIAGHRVIRWRWQAGKSRLDHFLLIGKKFNYLFVSSPYGSNGGIEEIISRTVYR